MKEDKACFGEAHYVDKGFFGEAAFPINKNPGAWQDGTAGKDAC